MSFWPKRPVIYEIHTARFLYQLRKSREEVDLGTLPEGLWREIASQGVDAVWLMGIWQRSPRGQELLLGTRTEGGGSPYCIRNYEVEESLGGLEGLRKAREVLSRYGLKLLLDFVPNHTAPDHPWTETHPEFYVSGEGLMPEESLLCGGRLIARGRDPFFPPWPDVVQLNAFHPGYRQAAVDTLLKIADYCDGVRCDMAMLFLNDVFEQVWGKWVKETPRGEFWEEVIGAVKEKYPSFLFLAEVYWGRERDLINLGFDYCYDKALYDLLIEARIPSLRRHLSAEVSYQDSLCRFLENHDEERAARVFPLGKLEAANIVTATLPGALLFYDGQWEGRCSNLPVYVLEIPPENPNDKLKNFYRFLTNLRRQDVLKYGTWQLLPPFQTWPDNTSGENLFAWSWRLGEERLMVVVNYSPWAAQGRLTLEIEAKEDKILHLYDVAANYVYPRRVSELNSPGLFVDLPPWGYHVFFFSLL